MHNFDFISKIQYHRQLHSLDRLKKKNSKNEISWKPAQWEPSCPMPANRHAEANGLFLQFCERT